MPASLTLTGLSWSTLDGTPLFLDINLNFGPGRTGLVGGNGCGKSTLLCLVAGEIEPVAGVIMRTGTVGWMRQDAGQPGESVAQVLGVDRGLSCIARLLGGKGSTDDARAADWSQGDRLIDQILFH